MKNILLIFAITVSSAAFAQGNLQFNRVIDNHGTFSSGNTSCGPTGGHTCNSSPIWTVTSDNSWKIEASNCFGYYYFTGCIWIQLSGSSNSADSADKTLIYTTNRN